MGMLRVMLAFAVLLSHLPVADIQFMGGGLAVQSFFILSGFYMALVLNDKYNDRTLFYGNRLLRILPTYLVMLVVAAVLLFCFNASATASPGLFATAYSHPATAIALGLQNLALLGQELLFWFRLAPDGALVFDASGALPTEQSSVAWQVLLVPQAWSLSMELMFYAIAPFLARLRWHWLAALAAASIALRLGGHLLPVDYNLWQGRFFPTALFLFVLGMLSHRLLPVVRRLPHATGWCAGVFVLAWTVLLPKFGLAPEPARWLTYAVVTATIPFVFNISARLRFDRWIGDLSYPIYLSHLAIIGAVLTWAPPHPALVAISATLLLSLFLLVVVDGPVDQWRQRRVAERAG